MGILIQKLLKSGIIDRDKAAVLESKVKEAGQKEEEAILANETVSESELFELKSQELKMPLREVSPEELSLKVLELIPEDSARFYKMIPLEKDGRVLQVGMVYPEDLVGQEALKFLERQGGWQSQAVLIRPSTFNQLLKQYRTLKQEVEKALGQLEKDLGEEKAGQRLPGPEDFERLVEEAPITKVVAVILNHGVDGLASDIHIEPTEEKLRVRFRVDGVLHSSILLPLKLLPAIVSRVKILAGLKIDESRVPQDGRFSTKINNKNIDFRVSTFPTVLGEKAAIRILDPSQGLRKMEDLGLNPGCTEQILESLAKPFGLILATGPTGSGKSTTLYTLLRFLNKEGKNIVTLEDPVEYFIDGVNQSQIKSEIGYSFASGLRHVLRQAPDIIMVGEIRDEETAGLTIHSALTGHLVLSTLHTNDALGVIPRLIDLGVRPFLIPPTLKLAIAQRLVRKLCLECRQKTKASRQVKEMVANELASLPEGQKKNLLADLELFSAKGCKKCDFDGFSGRVGIFEILAMTDELANLILKEPSETKIKAEAVRQGMTTMRQDGLLKALEGLTTVEEVLAATEKS